MKYYRVRDLAERYQLSRQTIHYYLDKFTYEDKKRYLSNKGRILLINQSGVNYLDVLITTNKLFNDNEDPLLIDQTEIEETETKKDKDLTAVIELIDKTYATKEYIKDTANKIILDQKETDKLFNKDIKELALKCQKNEIDVIHTNQQLKKGLIILSVLVVILIVMCLILWFNMFEIGI